MCLFTEAVNSWKSMNGLSHRIVFGHKNKTIAIEPSFRDENFAHLIGMQYLSDIDFAGIPRDKLNLLTLSQLISAGFDESVLSRAVNWDKVYPRMVGVVNMQKMIESDFDLYYFSAFKLPFHSEIDAKYCIRSKYLGDDYFLMIGEDSAGYFYRSIFKKNDYDYSANQIRVKVLQKSRIQLLYQSSAFKAPPKI